MLDGLGSVTGTGTLDSAGAVVSSSAYSVFGQPAGTGAVGLGDAFGYTGHAWDGDAGMHFARARWYDAGVGRFASEDPIDAMNLYTYVGNRSMDLTDPTGEVAVFYARILDPAMRIIGSTGALIVTYFTSGALGGYSLLSSLASSNPWGGCARQAYGDGAELLAIHATAVWILMGANVTPGLSVYARSKLLLAELAWFLTTELLALGSTCED
ncbi:RHS repeat-associated core domain-containing protein [Nocardioides jishulii]|uniref:RHS repeat-associated core domain-containing protein n=1 Tax=Nocardioides jishulii TaxID=2575440 RepID=UPI0014858595|nr:RHS repeat-associated core domain-containing protein [Nocardioides jishulii]